LIGALVGFRWLMPAGGRWRESMTASALLSVIAKNKIAKNKKAAGISSGFQIRNRSLGLFKLGAQERTRTSTPLSAST
jgi:hypothetical protein